MLVMSLLLLVLAVGCGSSGATKTEMNAESKEKIATANASEAKGNLASLKDKKVLVAYFSWSGNTRKLAQEIQQKTGGHIFEMEVSKPYPKDYQATVDQAKAEASSNARPSLKNKVDNFAQYDVIFLGFPNWWGSAPMPVVTFMESYDWKGKTVVPFFTHGGGGVQSCNDAVTKTLSSAKVMPYLCLSGSSVNASEVDKWLNTLKF